MRRLSFVEASPPVRDTVAPPAIARMARRAPKTIASTAVPPPRMRSFVTMIGRTKRPRLRRLRCRAIAADLFSAGRHVATREGRM
jgi:hypothetical protein